MESQHYKFKVQMACKGCSGAVERAVKKLDGIKDVKTDLETQLVEVFGSVPHETVLEAIKNTGKKVEAL